MDRYGNAHVEMFATFAHADTNHLYDDYLPYAFHLKLAVKIAHDFIHLIPETDRSMVIDAIWCHDIIEDARKTYNDVKEVTGARAADIVYAVTNEKGKTRKERANSAYYEGIAKDPYAIFTKLCDRLANVTYGKMFGGKMIDMYRKEQEGFEKALNITPLMWQWPMVERLHELLEIK